jgi:hypothetical protein
LRVSAEATSACGTRSGRTQLTVPLHKELKRGTLTGILTDAGLDRDQLRRLL